MKHDNSVFGNFQKTKPLRKFNKYEDYVDYSYDKKLKDKKNKQKTNPKDRERKRTYDYFEDQY